MNFSAHSGEDGLSFDALVLDFISSSGLKAYDSRRTGDCSLFLFHFQVKGSDFLLGIEINDDGNCYPMSQKGVLRRPRRLGSENSFRSKTRPPPSSLSSFAIIMFCITTMGLRVPNFSGARSFWLLYEFIFAVNRALILTFTFGSCGCLTGA